MDFWETHRGKLVLVAMALVTIVRFHGADILRKQFQLDLPRSASLARVLQLGGDTKAAGFLVEQTVEKDMIFATVAEAAGVNASTTAQLIVAAEDVYDLSTIVLGRTFYFLYEYEGGELVQVEYRIDSEDRLMIRKGFATGTWAATREAIPYEVRTASIEGVIDSSLYGAIVNRGGDDRLALALAEMFAWQVDFAADIRTSDSFKVYYEDRYVHGEYVMPGKILAAEFTNDGRTFRGVYFVSDTTKEGYYDEHGDSLQKVFLKAPLQYRYISSGYSYARVNPVTRAVSAHRGIDYAAPAGTPSVSVGDGTVIQAGWNGYYGISVTVRHNDTYKTVYGHFQSLAKGIVVGAKVKQGQVVGYVGSTGQSTGPHLHYEMHKNGAHVNPFTVEVPSDRPVADADRAAFEQVRDELLGELK